MKLTPRPYQKDAVDAVISHIKKRLSPCLIELATGAGKSLVVSLIAKFLNSTSDNKRVICMAPSKELVEQNHSKYVQMYSEPASIYCGSAGSKDLRHRVIFASPITLLNNIETVAKMGISGIIIDEAHGVTPTMIDIVEKIRAFVIGGEQINKNVRVIGMTATPYRTGTGYIYASDNTGVEPIFHDESRAREPYYSKLLYRVTAGELIEQGYLSKVDVGESDEHYDTSKLEMTSAGKFSASTVSAAFEGSTKTETITKKVEFIASNTERKGVIIFAATISHAEEIAGYLPAHQVRVVTGKLKMKERAQYLDEFKAQRVKYLVNVDVLTTGFDAPHVDLVAIMRATESPGLLQQMIGRGLRLSDGKKECIVLDYAENVGRHGLEEDIFTPDILTKPLPGDTEQIAVVCPACNAHSVKKRRNDDIYDGLLHDRFGNFLVPGTERVTAFDEEGNPIEHDGIVMTMKILDARQKDEFGDVMEVDIPVPAHYSRRCGNQEAFVINGVGQQCQHRYSMKICASCYAENDIAARHCVECKERLVDPNGKLSVTSGIAGSMSDGETRRVKCYGASFEPWMAKSGNKSLKVDYRTEIGEITAWHTKRQSWIFGRIAKLNGREQDDIESYDECAGWKNAPMSITVRKITQNGYTKLEVKGVHYES